MTEPILKRHIKVQCLRCGIDAFSEEAWIKRQERGHTQICVDCERFENGPVVTIVYQGLELQGACRTWHGDYDLDDNPLDRFGNRFTGDVALCGHKDCVTLTHRPGMKQNRVRRGGLSGRQVRAKKAFSFELWLAVSEKAGQL